MLEEKVVDFDSFDVSPVPFIKNLDLMALRGGLKDVKHFDLDIEALYTKMSTIYQEKLFLATYKGYHVEDAEDEAYSHTFNFINRYLSINFPKEFEQLSTRYVD